MYVPGARAGASSRPYLRLMSSTCVSQPYWNVYSLRLGLYQFDLHLLYIQFLTKAPRETTSVFVPLSGPPKSRVSAHRFYGLRDAQNRSSQLKSLRIKKKGESRGVLRQKLHLAGCTIIVGAGRGGADEMGVRPYLPGTGTRYQVPIMYCKTYYTVNTRI